MYCNNSIEIHAYRIGHFPPALTSSFNPSTPSTWHRRPMREHIEIPHVLPRVPHPFTRRHRGLVLTRNFPQPQTSGPQAHDASPGSSYGPPVRTRFADNGGGSRLNTNHRWYAFRSRIERGDGGRLINWTRDSGTDTATALSV